MIRTILDSDAARQALQDKLLISICAGVRISQFKKILPSTSIIRAMPNTWVHHIEAEYGMLARESADRVALNRAWLCFQFLPPTV